MERAAAAAVAPEPRYAYHAFISYHQASDRDLAQSLQHALHRFAKPLFRPRAVRLFLDRTNLAAQPQLWPAIEEGLKQSEYFLLLACPESAASPWVRREIEWWLMHRSAARMLLVQTGGEVRWDQAAADFDWARTTALPETLSHALPGEPYCLDLRIARPAAAGDPRFLDAVASLAATLQGRSKDELFGEDVRQHRRTIRLTRAAITVLLVLTLLVALAAVFAVRRGNQAIEQRGLANLRSIEAEEARGQAESANTLAERRRWLAEERRKEAEHQPRIALARQLAAQAELTRNRRLDALPQSAALAVESLRLVDSAEARQTLSLALPLLPQPAGSAQFAGQFLEVALSPSAAYFAAAGRKTLGIWEVASGRSVALLAHSYKVRAVAVSPDGRWAAMATADRKARIWNIATGLEQTVLAHQNTVEALAFSFDSRLIATASFDRTARIWSAGSGQPVATLQHTAYVLAVAFTPDGRYVATGTYGGLHLWDIDGPRDIASSQVDEMIDSVAVAAGHEYVVGATRRGSAVLWDTKNKQMQVFRQPGQVRAVAISDDGRYLATASLEGSAQVWDRASRIETVRAVHPSGATAVGFDPTGTHLVTAGRDGRLRTWTGLHGGAPSRSIPRYGASRFAFSADGRLLAVAEPGIGELREALSGRVLMRASRATIPRDVPRVIAVDPGGKLWATGDQQGQVFVHRLPNDYWWAKFAHAKQQSVIAAVFSPGGRRLATSSYDRTTRIWDLAAKQEGARVDFGAEAVAFSPDGRYLAAGGQDRTARLWDSDLKRELARIPHEDYVLAVAFSPDGRWLATGGRDRAARLWSVPQARESPPLLPHDSEVAALAFSPDGRLLATGSRDGTARLWDLGTHQEVLRLPQSGDVVAVAFTRDGRYLLTADSGGLTAAWYLRSADLARETCQRLLGVLPRPLLPGCPAPR